jgi:hypothetical protein
VNRAVDSAAAQQRPIRSVHNRIHLPLSNISLNDADRGFRQTHYPVSNHHKKLVSR